MHCLQYLQCSLTYIYEAGVVALAKVVQNAGFIEIGQTSHVFDLLKLGRIHLLGCIQVHLNFLIWSVKRGMFKLNGKCII